MAEERATNRTVSVTLQPVGSGDEAFLRAVYASTRAEELARVPWSEEQRAAFIEMQFQAQQRHYQTFYPEARHEIILARDLPAGRIYVDRRADEIRILDITLLPEYRGQGIGVRLIKDMLDEASETDRTVSVYVESFNPSLALFESLGFRQTEGDGVNLLMQWRSGSSLAEAEPS